MGMNLTDSHLCVLLLGAGSSADYDLPVMRGFMDAARMHYFARRAHYDAAQEEASKDVLLAHYEATFDFYSRCRASSWAFQRDWDNIEELYTQADLLRLTHLPTSEEGSRLCMHIAWSIWDVYRRVRATFPLRAICEKIRESGLRPVIITTNYDLLCEAALGFHGLEDTERRTRPPFASYYPGFKAPTFGHGHENEILTISDETLGELPFSHETLGFVPIIKLHGSVNWFSINQKHWVATTHIKGVGPLDPNHASAIDLEHVENDQLFQHLIDGAVAGGVKCDGRGDLAPAIIPPMLGKSSTSNVIANQWKTAMQAISAAKQIVVIGYSFPQTDAFMPRLLAQGMESHLTFERLLILDRQPEEEWESRLSSLFTPVFRQQRVRFIRQIGRVAHNLMSKYSLSDWENQLWNNRFTG